MNNGMMMLIAGLGLLWLLSRRATGGTTADFFRGSRSIAAEQSAAYDVGF
jgi:hypothetical protein